MEQYRFLVQQNPDETSVHRFCQPGFFFNEWVHLQQQAEDGFYLLIALNLQTQQADARCAFFLNYHAVVSPSAAPFGAIEFANTLPDLVLDQFIRMLVQIAQTTSRSALRLVNYPTCYAPVQAQRLANVLSKHGFRLTAAHQTSFLPITNQPFESTIQSAQRRRLRKCQRASFRFHHWVKPPIPDVVQFLVETRQQQGYSLTLSPTRLTHLLQTFPDHFLVFTVTNGSEIAALALAVKVRNDILYNFMPAYRTAYRDFSPMVMLIDGMVSYCRINNIGLLDLGISLDHTGALKPGLLRFKRSLGARLSTKLVFEKALSHL